MPQSVAVAVVVVLAAVLATRQAFTRFRQRVRSFLAHTPDIQWIRNTSNGMVCAVLGYAVEIDLLSTYVVRWRRRLDEAALCEDLAATLRGRVPAVAAPPFSLVRDRLLPLLKQTAAMPPVDGYVRENRLLRRPLDNEISIVYTIEGQHRITLITEGMQTAWQMTLDDLHQLALHNLRARTLHILEEIGGRQAEYVDLDGFDAARLLVADLIVPSDITHPVLAIPHEHACLIADDSRRDQLAVRASALFRAGRAPLTTRLYRLGAPETLPVPDAITPHVVMT